VKVLQLSSDWKWTGPAEPMLLLHEALRGRGDTVWLGCPDPPAGAEASLAESARRLGRERALGLERARGIRPLRDRSDARALRRFIEERDVEVIHCWHSRDHALAWSAASARRRAGRMAIVRSVASAEPIVGSPWNRALFGAGTDGLLCVSAAAAAANERVRGGRPVSGVLGCVDLSRFDGPRAPDPALRAQLGLETGAPVIGVVARVQRHRRFDLLLAAMKLLAATHPEARLLVLGRGTHLDEVAVRPARELGIADRVVFAGHHKRAYPEILRTMDFLCFLVPGSDGSCRAVLEAAACGVPAVASRRGALPEIVADGESGLLVDEDADALSLHWRRLLDDEQERRRLGAGALLRARKLFRPDRYAEDVHALYRSALAHRGAV
jgi:glycosyltransferase involved in cell wall biosynthesis